MSKDKELLHPTYWKVEFVAQKEGSTNWLSSTAFFRSNMQEWSGTHARKYLMSETRAIGLRVVNYEQVSEADYFANLGASEKTA